ncbi:MAG: tRNA uridine-5-carboxymethylaminomethyl(34) synthesis GTPase MnmE [Alphaproteobacteria bacterium]
MNATDTIFALATPYAKSGVAIIRISGKQALAALSALSGKQDFAHAEAFFKAFHDGAGTLIDKGLAIYFASPRSFTGEDTAEFHLHGSPAVIKHMLETLAGIEGLRLAEAGEFTRRAYLNGKMDLLEAEGLADLIDSETLAQKNQAMRQMGGEASKRYSAMREQVIRVLALLEAYIDFPDEDIPESVLTGLTEEVAYAKTHIEGILNDNRRGERLRDGFYVVICGAPNAGKSSLINILSGREAAIVSHHAGTTRDAIEITMDLGGFPVILTDTAGIRETSDEIEGEGVRRALKRAGDADLKLVLFDAGALPSLDAESLKLVDEKTLVVITKCDAHKDAKKHILSFNNNILYISSQTGEGVNALLEQLKQRVSGGAAASEAALITRSRHRAQLEQALAHLNRFSVELPLEIACEELRQAAGAIGKITGKIQVDDVLDVIFKQFCIGK